MAAQPQSKSFSWPVFLTKTFSFILLSFLTILLLVWLLSPSIIHWQANKLLANEGLKLSENTSIRINPFALKLSLEQVVIAQTSNDEVQLELKTGVLDVKLLPLFKNIIESEQISFNGLMMKASMNEKILKVAGFKIDQSDQELSKDIAPETRTPNEEEPTNWTIKSDLVRLQESNILLNYFSENYELSIKNWSTKNIAITTGESIKANLNTKLATQFKDSKFNLNAKINFAKDKTIIESELSLNEFPLDEINHLLDTNNSSDFLKLMDGKFNFNSQQTITLSENNIQVDAKDIVLKTESLNIKELLVNQDKLDLTSKEIEISLPILSFTKTNNSKNANTSFSLENKLNLISEEFLLNNVKGEKLVGFENLILVDLDLILKNNNIQVTLPEFSINNLTALKPEDKKALYQSEKLALNKLSFIENHISLDSIKIDGMQSNVELTENKKIEALSLLDNLIAEQDKVGTESTDETAPTNIAPTNIAPNQNKSEEDKPPVSFELNSFQINGDSIVYFKDNQLTPAFEQEVKIEQLEIASIDSKQPENKTSLNAQFKTDQFSQGKVNGWFQLFASKLNMNLDANLKEFSLPKVSPYMSQALGFEMLTGQFDTNLKINIQDDLINGNTSVAVRGLSLSSSKDDSESTMKTTGAISLNSALNMLKDDKGNLELEIPISGDVNSPDFGINDFIGLVTKKVIMSASKSYLMDAFIPYASVLSVAMVAGEYLLQVDVEDLEYEVGQVEISEKQKVFIDEFIKLLNDEKDTQIKLCAFSTFADFSTLPEASNDKSAIQNKLSDEVKNQLIQIAKLRGKNFKSAIVNQGKIESARLLVCQPQFDEDPKAIPRIEFEI